MTGRHTRPAGVDDTSVEAAGRLSEACEYLVRARGHLYSLHQLVGRVDLLADEAADLLERAGHQALADHLRAEVVGRNVLPGRWTFQVVEAFDETYYDVFAAAERRVREELLEGRRHVYESEMKDARRTDGAAGHERRPSDL